jgi:hypothetical protein
MTHDLKRVSVLGFEDYLDFVSWDLELKMPHSASDLRVE